MKEISLSPTDYEQLREFRRNVLHANPEVAENEKETAKNVAEFLEQLSPDLLLKNLGGHGVLAVFGKGNPCVLLRAELDALPIEEINEFNYRSVNAGVSHKCGHDGHTTILCGVAKALSQQPPANGSVALLFQPAEENGVGAEAVLKDPAFSQIQPDYVFALHNLPGLPVQQIVVKEGAFTAAVTSIIIQLKGKTSHAAEPEHGINPALAIAEIISESDKWNNNDPHLPDFVVVTPVHITMGEKAYGISAGYGEVHLTIRTWSNDLLAEIKRKAEELVKEKGKKYGIETSVSWTQNFFSNQNNPEAVDMIRKAAKQAGLDLKEATAPFKWGEDFGLFTNKYKGAMFGLGSGECTPALHNPDYDFPDDIIPAGINVFLGIVKECLHD